MHWRNHTLGDRFPVYRIPRVRRSDYIVLDRQGLARLRRKYGKERAEQRADPRDETPHGLA